MAARQTSLDAYNSLSCESVNDSQALILAIIRSNRNLTNTEIADKLGLPINRVTPRTNELVKLGLVVESFRRDCFCSECNTCRSNGLLTVHRQAISWEVRR